jgi:hypothetical protein
MLSVFFSGREYETPGVNLRYCSFFFRATELIMFSINIKIVLPCNERMLRCSHQKIKRFICPRYFCASLCRHRRRSILNIALLCLRLTNASSSRDASKITSVKNILKECIDTYGTIIVYNQINHQNNLDS